MDALARRLLLLAEVEVEGDIEHQHPGEVLGEGPLLVGRQAGDILHTLMIVVGKGIHHHRLQCPFPCIIPYRHGMNAFVPVECFAPKHMIGREHIHHRHPLLVHPDDASTEAPVAMRMGVGIASADVAVEVRIQLDGQVLLEGLKLKIGLQVQAMKTFLIIERTDKHPVLEQGFFHNGLVIVAVSG